MVGSSVQAVLIQTILVPQGAEHQAVCRGLRQAKLIQGKPAPVVIPIPIGLAAEPVLRLRAAEMASPVLVMGLCGSLQPVHSIGAVVLYQRVLAAEHTEPAYQTDAPTTQQWSCDATLIQQLPQRLSPTLVTAWSSERFIQTAAAKQQLAAVHRVEVVDMEAKAILGSLPTANVAMLRVVSDDCNHDLPDLATAISPTGNLLPLHLTRTALRHPIGMSRLISGSLRGLQVLQQVTTALFSQ
jgi:hypothetical protein